MIVTIDGPAGAGKSTVARELARRLGFRFLDTGAMYRAVALAALRRSIDWEDTEKLVELCPQLSIVLKDDHVLLDGEDVTNLIRTSEVTAATRHSASNPGVRRHLVALQRKAAEGRDVITEGRDQGTVVFPDAACKIFLTASPEERARRRADELARRGEQVPHSTVLEQQEYRDRQDRSRSVGPLTPADDAMHFITDSLSLPEVVDQLEKIIRERMAAMDAPRAAR